jgi:hypothetical protein
MQQSIDNVASLQIFTTTDARNPLLEINTIYNRDRLKLKTPTKRGDVFKKTVSQFRVYLKHWRLFMSRLVMVCVIPFIIFLPNFIQADTNITQNITQDTTWSPAGSPYLIMNDIQVFENVTLTILPDVEVVFQGMASMEIGGQIVARGAAANPIRFSSNNVWNRTHSSSNIGGISFLETAPSALFKSGDRPTFIYDYTNNQLLMEYDDTPQRYESGSIFNYCEFDNFDIAIKASDTFPCLMNSTITNCYYGLLVDYDPELPRYRWLYVYNNTFENCEAAIKAGMGWAVDFRRGIALICGNTIRDCGLVNTLSQDDDAMITIDGDRSGFFIFNNQIINNAGLGLGTIKPTYDYFPTEAGVGPLIFMAHNSITHNYSGIAVNGWNALLHNYIAENKTAENWTLRVLGAGAFLTGPVGMVFNNSIQLNAVNGVTQQTSHGDGVALSSLGHNKFILNYNNFGNSGWDVQDLYLYTDGDNCADSKLMNVDARFNAWNVPDINIPSHIYDQNDDTCSGTVAYTPSLSPGLTPLNSNASLQSPADNAYMPGTSSLAFSWSPVSGATKYMIGIFGKDSHYGDATLSRLEVISDTSITFDFSQQWTFDYGMKVVHWFVIAGNESGWGLPSEVRKVTFSPDPYLVTGIVENMDGIPVAGVYVGYESPTHAAAVYSFTDQTGNYTLIPEENVNQQEISPNFYMIKKQGYVTCYTFVRGQKQFDVAPDLMIVSPQERDAIFTRSGIMRDSSKGEIAGVVINESDEALAGATVSIEPASGSIYYPDDNGGSGPGLTTVGTTGQFIILNVAPGTYKLTAAFNGSSFDTTLTVYQGSTTIDALIENASTDGSSADDSGGASGSGGGGGCFVRSLYK